MAPKDREMVEYLVSSSGYIATNNSFWPVSIPAVDVPCVVSDILLSVKLDSITGKGVEGFLKGWVGKLARGIVSGNKKTEELLCCSNEPESSLMKNPESGKNVDSESQRKIHSGETSGTLAALACCTILTCQ